MDNDICIMLMKYVPICIPFIMPFNVLIGIASITEGIMSCFIMILFIVILIVLLINVYEKLVFNTLTIKQLMKKEKRANE